MITDSHCHLDKLDLKAFDGDLGKLLQEARDRGVERFLCICVDKFNVEKVIDIAGAHNNVYATVGVHPLHIKDSAVTLAWLLEHASRERVIGIGESGLDYHYSPDNQEEQKAQFELHLQASCQTNQPCIIHTRNAQRDTLSLINEYQSQGATGLLHCFTETMEMAREALDLGFYISISGIVTFASASELRNVVKFVPLDRLLIETDSPWLAPVPYRGESNRPAYVREVAEFCAELKSLSLDELSQATNSNFERIFRLQ